MAECIKTFITAIVSGLTAPLPVSSAAHFNFFSNVVGIAGDEKRMALYYYAFMLAFSLVIFITYRKIYTGTVKALFISKKNTEAYNNSMPYRKVSANLGVSIIPTLILFIPVSKEKLLIDLFDSFLDTTSLLLTGFACIISACVLLIALWYTRKTNNEGLTADKKNTLRFSFYQLPCYIIPGFSHIAAGSSNLLISDVKIKTFASELYVYLAPSLFIVSAVKVIKAVADGILFDPVSLIVGVIGFGVAAKLVMVLVSKFNLRRLFGFFSAYSAAFGIFIALVSFFLN